MQCESVIQLFNYICKYQMHCENVIRSYNCMRYVSNALWISNEIQVVMPQNYYSKQMVGAQVDQVKFYLILYLLVLCSFLWVLGGLGEIWKANTELKLNLIDSIQLQNMFDSIQLEQNSKSNVNLFCSTFVSQDQNENDNQKSLFSTIITGTQIRIISSNSAHLSIWF